MVFWYEARWLKHRNLFKRTVDKMDAAVSPTSLQQMSTAAAASWLSEWSGMVGQFAARMANAKQQLRQVNITGRAIQYNFMKRPHQCTPEASHVCPPTLGSQPLVQIREAEDPMKNIHAGPVNRKRGRSCRCKSHYKKEHKSTTLKYEIEPSSLHGDINRLCLNENMYSSIVCETQSICDSQQLGFSSSMYPSVSDSRSEILCDSSFATTLKNSDLHSHCLSVNSFDIESIKLSITHCCKFMRYYLPPAILNQIIHTAWQQLSHLVVQRSNNESVLEYQVIDWLKKACGFLQLAVNVSDRKFVVDISGIPESLVENVLNVVYKYFPLNILNALVLPREDFKKTPTLYSYSCRQVCRNILLCSALSTLNLHSKLCDDSLLSALSGLPLKELSIGSNLITEKGIVSGLSNLPFEAASDVICAFKTGEFRLYSDSLLRKSLQKLDLSSQNLPPTVYNIIPILFPELQFYNPHRSLVQCIESYGRLTPLENSNQQGQEPNILRFVRVDMGYSSRAQFVEVARICPAVQEISLIVDLNAEPIFEALNLFHHLTQIKLTYFPSSSSSPPKFSADVLLPILQNFKPQLKGLSLTGFNINGNVLHKISQLPDLQQLNFADCWLSNPRSTPLHPFPSLRRVSLTFLPPNSTMKFLTMGKCVQSLNLDLKASEWEGNALTDTYIKDLVSTGVTRTLHCFSASSSYLTTKSLQYLAALPRLKVIGHLASWGLTEEELRCVDHSGPQHIQCIL
ncbi:hypothetical protein SK128_009709 [Halocaridina rubra]|uniref:Uncharacterized protein n=1 Tax=Halocaridina rubra TaxID=373956 RepID=A0AAN8XTB3_HALRR